MKKRTLSEFTVHDMSLIYQIEEESGTVGLQLVPKDRVPEIVSEKEYLPEPLVQVKLAGDDYPFGFSQGRTMRNSQSVRTMFYEHQEERQADEHSSQIVTVFRDARGYRYEHVVCFDSRSNALEIYTVMINESNAPVTAEMLSSFTLGAITPFVDREAEESLVLHRLLSTWSAEGRLVSTPIEELQLEPSWQKYSANCLRFGQAGSMPVNGYFPFAAIEDIKTGVTWGVQLTQGGSWQIEAYRRDFAMSLSGGLADREFGHWLKTLQAGERFVTPKAVVTVVSGDVDDASTRLVENMRKTLSLPECEKSMPVLFNEFCTTWGQPNEVLVKDMAQTLRGRCVEYFVIDAGWFADDLRGWESNIGEWVISKALFPSGMKKTVETIRECGMRPGIWFEFEVSARDSVTFQLKDELLKRDEIPITSGNRRFWDFRRSSVQDYLAEKVIGFLKEYGFEYLKIDYNETFGIGCDGAESLGEGLREQILAVQEFFMKIRQEIPQLIMECCSSGGHRLVPSFLEITSMSSFSDAHECDEIPIIAANMHRVILPRQSQIWAVLKCGNPLSKFYYQVASSFLGRLCLSGDVLTLNSEQWVVVENGIDFYREAAPVIDEGITKRYGSNIKSYRKPKGWQGVVRESFDKTVVLVVCHTFHEFGNDVRVPVLGNRKILKLFAREGITVDIKGRFLIAEGLEEFDGFAVLLK